MKTYYCVVTSYDDYGRVTSAIVAARTAKKKPKSTYKSTARKDIYTDWFCGLDEAKQYVREALSA